MCDTLFSENDVPSSVIFTQERCQVCWKSESTTSLKPDLKTNLYFCKACLLPVHKACYGLPPNSEKMFFCDRCLDLGPGSTCVCEICGQSNGALRKVQDKWLHVTCGLSYKLIADWATMTLSPFRPNGHLKLCAYCGTRSFGVFKCGDCEKHAHLLCALKENSVNIFEFLVKNEFFCADHYANHEKYCFCQKTYVEGELFMIACDACDTWYHGDCLKVSQSVGENIEHYICKFCDAWGNLKVKLEKEDDSGKISQIELPLNFTNFKLKDWLILARTLYKRAAGLLEKKSKIEELIDIREMIKNLPFNITHSHEIEERIKLGNAIMDREKEILMMLKDPPDETQVPIIQSFMNDAKKTGIIVNSVPKLSLYIDNCQNLSQIKEILENPKIYTLSQVKNIYETNSKKFSKDIESLIELKKLIINCENWLSEIKNKLRQSQLKVLGQKMGIEEVKISLQKAKTLPFSMQNEVRIVEDEIKTAEDWDKKYKQMSRPMDFPEFQMLLQEVETLAIETPHMRSAANKFEEYTEWVKKTNSIISPSANAVLPNLDQVKAHLAIGESEVEPFIDIKELKAAFIEKIQEAETWKSNAEQAIASKVSPQRLTSLVREARSIICLFPELETLEKRSNINKRISEIIHKKHKEDDLLNLLQEAKEWNADEDFIQALHSRIQSIHDLKHKVKETLEQNMQDPIHVYSKLLEELKSSNVDLVDEKNQIEEKIKSLKWLQQVKETLAELEELKEDDFRRKKKADIDVIKNLVAKGEKIIYRDSQADEMLQELNLKLWEIEYQKFQMLDEITLENLKEIEARALVVKSSPESLLKFQDLLSDVNVSLQYFEGLLSNEIGKTLSCDLLKLRSDINNHKEKLESYGMLFPDKYSKVLQWDKWIDWCINTETLFKLKPSIDKLYEANQEAISLSIPPTVESLTKLSKVILDYEQWLYKYTSYSSARKWFSSQNFDIQHYLKRANERPKSSTKQITELLETALLLNINCEQEIKIMRNDLKDLENWVIKYNQFFNTEKYEDLLQKCKKSYESFIETASCKEFYALVKEYCFGIFIEVDDFGIKLCSYEWNISGQRLLQLKGKISLEEWNDFFMSIEYLNKDYLDQATLERLKAQNVLRIQIEDQLKKIKNLESSGQETKDVNVDVLEILAKQIAACKIVLTNEENYVKSTLEKCKTLSSKLSELLSQRAFLQDFKNLQVEVVNLPVSIPETSSKLKEIIEKTATLSLRARILKEHAIKNKIERSKVEQFLNDYSLSDAKLEDGENMFAELDYSKKILEEALSYVYDKNSSLDQLNHVSGKMNNMKIFMGAEEKELKIQLWKRKLELSHTQKVNYSIILGWYNEGVQMKDYSMQEDLDRLELYVRKGEEFKQKLSECSSLEEIQNIETETEALPFDLSHAIIEHKTRISLGKSPQETLQNTEVPTTGFIEGIENRPASRKQIEQAISKDIYFNWTKHPQKATKIAQRIEEILYNNLQGNGYKKAVITMQNIINSLQEYGGFSEKLSKGEITPEELSLLNTSEVKVPKVIQRIFNGTPSVSVTIHRSLLKSSEKSEPDLQKKKKIVVPEKSHPKKEISNLKSMIKSIKPIEEKKKNEVKPQVQANPASGFSIAGLLNEVQAFNKKAEESKNPIKREEPKETVIVSEKYRNPSESVPKEKNPVDEWKELSKLRLQKSGFSTEESASESRAEEIPVRRSRNEEYYEEGKFSSDEDENGGSGAEAGKEEYNLMELAQKSEQQRRKHRKKAKLYDPFSSSGPKNKALPGSLLKIWTGAMEYGKNSIKVNMFSVESIELFQKIPKLASKLAVHGRTKQSELEQYISQNASGPASRSIVTSWIETSEPNEPHFLELINDLKEKSRAAVIRIDNTLTIYLSAITDSFTSFLNSVRININQKIDKSITPYINENEKLGCLIFFKKSSGSSSSLIDPEIIAHIDPSRVQEIEEDDLPEKEDMSPITSGDDENKGEKQENTSKILEEAVNAISSGANLNEILGNLKMAIETLKTSNSSQDMGPNNNEINSLISVIRMQVEQEAQKAPVNNPQNVSQFLSQQFVQRPSPYVFMPQGMMYPQQPIYPSPYYQQPPRPQMGSHGLHGPHGHPMHHPHMPHPNHPHPNHPSHIPHPPPPGMPHSQNPSAYRPPSPEKKYDDPRRNSRY